jgi:ATP-dependent helicase HrpB
MEPLPVDAVIPALLEALAATGAAVLEAPPGAGKTTRVPIALLEAGICAGRILVLEPRRVAARAAAERLAAGLGEEVGRRVGFRIRGEGRPGSAIEVVTGGVLTRLIQADPELPGIGAILFDEIHERSLEGDLGLALALEIREGLRPDLRLLAMSATLDAGPVAALMGGAPVITAQGRAFPVAIRHLDRPIPAGTSLEAAMADLVLVALGEGEGGLLAFLPGLAEIRRTEALLRPRLPAGIVLQPLHGNMPLAAQRAALAPLATGRKLVLATAIAETSLTIPDIRIVVDSGRARRARFDPASGMSRLVTERASRAEADQRAGRAGRTAPGRCYRLWTKGEEGAFPAFAPPEIETADLAPLALELALWGSEAIPFLTPPPAAPLAEARHLLRSLGALDGDGRITAHGRALARLPVHPRLGHMLIVAARKGQAACAADLAALLEARDPLGAAGSGADLGPRLAALAGGTAARHADPAALAAMRAEAGRLSRLVRAEAGRGEGEKLSAGAILSLAYPDRIARRRPGGEPRFHLSGGKGARLPAGDALAAETFLVAADLDGDPREALIRRALPVAETEIRGLHAGLIARCRFAEWSRRERAVIARDQLRLGALVLEDHPWRDAPAEARQAALLDGIRDLGIGALPWDRPARLMRARIEWLRRRGVDLPDCSDEGLADALETWLAPFLAGMSRIEDLARLDLRAALAARLDRDQASLLDRLAPASFTAPTGSRIAIDYEGEPSISVRLQELFGLTRHPVIGPDGIPLLIHLLSPAGRPVQSTSDLPRFWATSYRDVRRDLRGRYPRHPWPEDPASAEPTRRAKPRGR